MLFHCLPAFAIIQLHPVILSVFNLSGVLQGLGEQIPQVVVVRCILKAKVANVAEVLGEFLCH